MKGLLALKDVGVNPPPPPNVSKGHQFIPLININRVSWLPPDNSIHGITCDLLRTRLTTTLTAPVEMLHYAHLSLLQCTVVGVQQKCSSSPVAEHNGSTLHRTLNQLTALRTPCVEGRHLARHRFIIIIIIIIITIFPRTFRAVQHKVWAGIAQSV